MTLQDGQLSATLTGQSLLGNFPESAANSLFSQAFLNAFASDGFVNRPAVAPTFTKVSASSNHWALLSVSEINQNMNGAIQSAAKAYISGYAGFDRSHLGVFPSYTTFNRTAAIQYQEISLVSSRPFLLALWALDGVIFLVLVILLCAKNAEEMWLFSLQTMETVYRGMI